MNKTQKLSPKYWVLHHKQENDVILYTACKSRSAVVRVTEGMFGEDWFMDENLEIILVEIKLCDTDEGENDD